METLLLTIGFIGIIFLVLTPWHKTGTIVAIGSLVGYFYYAGVDSWTPILLFIVGLVLIALEVFIPGFGLLGILGVVSVALGLYFTTNDFGLMIRDLTIALITSTILIVILIRSGYSISNLDKIVLKANSQQSMEIEETEKKPQLSIGMVGEAVTPLRPSGKAIFEKDAGSYDVLSAEGHVTRGEKVVIQEILGTKIVVRKKIN